MTPALADGFSSTFRPKAVLWRLGIADSEGWCLPGVRSRFCPRRRRSRARQARRSVSSKARSPKWCCPTCDASRAGSRRRRARCVLRRGVDRPPSCAGVMDIDNRDAEDRGGGRACLRRSEHRSSHGRGDDAGIVGAGHRRSRAAPAGRWRPPWRRPSTWARRCRPAGCTSSPKSATVTPPSSPDTSYLSTPTRSIAVRPRGTTDWCPMSSGMPE